MTADGLPPYRQTAPRGARIEVEPDVNTSDNTSDDAVEPPSYDDAPAQRRNPRNPRNASSDDADTSARDERTDEKNRLIHQHNQQAHPYYPPPDYFASSSTDCPHWVERRCRLNARPRHCCTCMDKRPETEDGRYPVYMDGYAELGSVVRWAHYCEPCRNTESRLHRNFDTKARPPPGANVYRPSGSEQARAAKELADAKAKLVGGGIDEHAWFHWETSGQRKERERRERMERKEQGRLRHEAAMEAAERKKDDAWEKDQLQRLSRGDAVSSITVRRHFLMTSPGFDLKEKGKGKEKRTGKKKEKTVIGMFREHTDPAMRDEFDDPTMQPITTAEVRAARKLWEAGGIASDEDVREQQRWQEIERLRAEEAKQRREDEQRRRNQQREHREQREAKTPAVAPMSQPNEYEAYGDGADVPRSVSRTISRESANKRARAASSATSATNRPDEGSSRNTNNNSAWYSRLFRRWGPRR